jgi:catechol 2,3-dioxygenase-like lactoylglutathione lyase family enzyme
MPCRTWTERAFYRDTWKLKERSEQDGMVHLAAEGSDELFVVRLRQSDVQRIDLIGLKADTNADVDTLHDKVVAAGCEIIFAPRDLDSFGGGYGFRFFSTDGLPFEISAVVAAGETRAMTRGEAVPQKISHIVLHSPDYRAMAAFFVDVLGFRVSDWLGEFMVFLRCNAWHHRLAIVPGPPCLNHVAYDMLTVDDMMRGISRLRKAGTDLRWGPGRHTAGNDTFSYFTTPSGFPVEYTSELEEVDDEAHVAGMHALEDDVVDQWGIAQGGPHTMPKAVADKGLFVAAPV